MKNLLFFFYQFFPTTLISLFFLSFFSVDVGFRRKHCNAGLQLIPLYSPKLFRYFCSVLKSINAVKQYFFLRKNTHTH